MVVQVDVNTSEKILTLRNAQNKNKKKNVGEEESSLGILIATSW